jgi:hypothetical protein
MTVKRHRPSGRWRLEFGLIQKSEVRAPSSAW